MLRNSLIVTALIGSAAKGNPEADDRARITRGQIRILKLLLQ